MTTSGTTQYICNLPPAAVPPPAESLTVIEPNALTIWPHMHYVDLVTIMLTCVALLITILGIVIAVMSFIGYGKIKKTAAEHAVSIATKKLDEHLASSKFNKRVDDVLIARLEDKAKDSVRVKFERKGGENGNIGNGDSLDSTPPESGS